METPLMSLTRALPSTIKFNQVFIWESFQSIPSGALINEVHKILGIVDPPSLSSFQFLRSSTNLFLLNLSVADLLVLVTSCPTSLLENAMKTDAWIFGEVRK